MPNCDPCKRRVLLRCNVNPKKLVGLDELHFKLQPDKLARIFEVVRGQWKLHAPSQATPLPSDPFALCIAILALLKRLRLFVHDEPEGEVYQIRPDVMMIDCCCWSLLDAAAEGRLITKRSMLPHGTPEIRLDGAPLLVLLAEAKREMQLRPISTARLTTIVKEIYTQAAVEGIVPLNEDVRERVRKHPEVPFDTSVRLIDRVAAEIKPEVCSKGGRRPRHRK